jgi:hypothetical protein
MKDMFRPNKEPASIIYDAFHKEASKRGKKLCDEWIVAEREAVWEAARNYAQQHALTVPTMDQIKKAENQAVGHTDYALKWALGVAELLVK